MAGFTSHNFPGFQVEMESEENSIFWAGKNGLTLQRDQAFVIDATARDVGNTGLTTTLRAGLVMGVITASGKLLEYIDAAVDGSGVAYAILPMAVNMLENNVAVDRMAHVAIAGNVQAAKLIGADAGGVLELQPDFLFDDITLVP